METLGNQNKQKSCAKYNCKLCDYTTTRTTNMKLHYLNNHANKEERKKEFKFYCEACDFGNFSKGLFKLHMETKHK